MKQYKVIFVDWDGTLSNSRFWDRWTGTDKYQAVQKKIFEEGSDYFKPWMVGDLSHSEVLTYASEQTGIPYDELRQELQYSAEHMKYIDDQVLELVVSHQASGTKVVIATDNMDTFDLWTVPALGLTDLFDDILNSERQGALKITPHEDSTSKFFHSYLTKHGIKPGESVLIDNSLDAAAVERFGIDFLHVNDEASLTTHLKDLLQP